MVDYSTLLGEVTSERRRTVTSTPAHCLSLLGRANDTTPRYVLVSSGVERVDCDFGEAIVMDPKVFKFYLCFLDPLEILDFIAWPNSFLWIRPFGVALSVERELSASNISSQCGSFADVPLLARSSQPPFESIRDLLYG